MGAARAPAPEGRVLGLALAGLILVLCALPVARLALEALRPGAAARVLADPVTWAALGNSLATGAAGAGLALAVGALAALALGVTDARARGPLLFALVAPLMLAPQVTALAWLQVTGPQGPLRALLGLPPAFGARNPLTSAGGIALLLGVQYAPLVLVTLRAGLRALPGDLVEAARTAGAGPGRALRDVVLPLLGPSFAAAAALAFVSAVGNFGIPAFLGIPGGVVTGPTLIYQRLAGLGPAALAEVAVLAGLLGALAAAGAALAGLAGRRRVVAPGAGGGPLRPFALGRWRPLVEGLLWAYALAALVLPVGALLLASLVPAPGVPLSARTATLGNYAYALFGHDASGRALVNSLALSFTAAALLVAVAVLAAPLLARRAPAGAPLALRLAAGAASLCYAMPGVVLAIACVLLFLRPVLGVALYSTVWIILFAYLARFLTLALRPAVAGARALDPALSEAAALAGAGPWRRLRDVTAPLIAPSAAAGGLLVLLTAFGELTVSALLWSSGAETLGVVTFALEQGGETPAAAALGVLTVALTLALMLAGRLPARRLPPGTLPWLP